MRHRFRVFDPVSPALLTVLGLAVWSQPAIAQSGPELDRVLTLAESRTGPRSLSVDWGAQGYGSDCSVCRQRQASCTRWLIRTTSKGVR